MPDLTVRNFSFPEDYPAAVQLWQSAGPGIHLQRSDQPDEIVKKLARDPGLFIVAESDNHLVGTIIAGFDGRRGLIYHLAVAPEYRRQGIASRLMDEVEQRLKNLGCIRCYLLVTPENQAAMQFYEKRSWKRMTVIPYGKDLVE